MKKYGEYSNTRSTVNPDGTVWSGSGTQTNCGGFVRIIVRISDADAPGLSFSAGSGSFESAPLDGWTRGADVPPMYVEAMRSGVEEAYQELGVTRGIHFELISALVHPVDASCNRFRYAAQNALACWVEQRGSLPGEPTT